ncbi:MAG TPA: hypothetical protein VGH06_01485 [Candidatus Udaeobacter sp.]
MGPRGRQIRFGVVIADSAVYSSANQRCPSLTWHVGIGVGQLAYAYDAEMTRYLVPGQEYITIRDPLEQFSLDRVTDKGLAFLFFLGNERYRDLIREHCPRGMEGEVHNPVGRHVFYTYLVKPEVIRSNSHGPN